MLHWRPQAALQPGIRIDHGITEGSVVSPYYDAMVVLIAHGRDRDDAIRRLRAALAATPPLLGLRNNARFLRDLLDHPVFRRGETTTALLDEARAAATRCCAAPEPSEEDWCPPRRFRAARVRRGGPTAWRPTASR